MKKYEEQVLDAANTSICVIRNSLKKKEKKRKAIHGF